jgi:hypothetical protein
MGTGIDDQGSRGADRVGMTGTIIGWSSRFGARG